MTDVDLRLLGTVRLVVVRRDVVRHRPEKQAIVARLALDAGRPVEATELAHAAWPHAWPGHDRRQAVRRVSDELRDVTDALRGADPAVVRLQRPAHDEWSLHVAADLLDLDRFRTARDDGLSALLRHDVQTAIDRLDAATREFTRPALDGLPGPWADAQRLDLELEALEAHVVLADLVRRYRPDGDDRAADLHARFPVPSPRLWTQLVGAWTKDLDRDVLAGLLREAAPALGRRLESDDAADLRAALDAARRTLRYGTAATSHAGAPVAVTLYGPFRVVVAGLDVTPRAAGHAAVLAALVVRRGGSVDVRELARAGWPDDDAEARLDDARAALRDVMDLLSRTAPDAGVRTTRAGYELHTPEWWVDADQVRALRTTAADRLTSGRPEEAAALLAEVAQRTARPALEGLPGAWFDGPRQRLEDEAEQAGELLATALVDGTLTVTGRDAAPALQQLENLAARHPRSAALRERLMTGYHLAGRPQDALAVHAAALRDLGPGLAGRPAQAMTDLRRVITAAQDPLLGSTVRFAVLDGLRMTVLDRTVTPRGRARRHGLAALLLRRRTVVGADDLVRAVWGRPPVDPRASAERLVAEVLTAVEEATQPVWGSPDAEEAAARRSPLSVRAVPGGWVADLPPDALDLDVVEGLAERGLAAAARGDTSAAADALRAVLRLVPEQPLGDLDGPWFAAERERLVVWRAALVEPCVRAELACGRPADALPDLLRANASRPADEDLTAVVMAALHAAGRTADALAAYDRCAAELRRALGAAPGPTLQMQRRRIADDAGGGA